MDQAQQARRPDAELAVAARRGPGRRQGGWVGLVVLLIALVIVGLLARKALLSYGLLGGADLAKGGGARTPAAASATAPDVDSAPATPRNAIERARGLQQQVQKDAEEQSRRIDDSTQ